jgi:cell division initiation protein
MSAMELTAKVLREVEFQERLRGYHPDQVDEFLEQAALGVEELHERLRQANERAARAEARLAESGSDDDVLRRTLVLAQRTADAAVAEAEARAQAILAEADNRAQAILAEAEARAQAIVGEAERGVRAEVERLSASRAELAADLALLRQQLEQERRRAWQLHTSALEWLEANMPPSRSDEVVPTTESSDSAVGATSRPGLSPEARPEESPRASLGGDRGDEEATRAIDMREPGSWAAFARGFEPTQVVPPAGRPEAAEDR